jgi:cell wall-associated NlpC family hydrolase
VISGERLSPAGAIGVAQFMPGTWAEYGVDGNGDGVADPTDPADAIPSAAIYNCAVARIVRDVPGDPADNMLAAYNAGPGAVLNHKGVPPESFAGGETHHYVRIIRDLEKTLAAVFNGHNEQPPTDLGARIVHYARAEIGTPYAWGGGSTTGPTRGVGHGAGTVGYDCSGLTLYAVYQATDGRVTLPRTSHTQRSAGRAVSRNQLRAGDLIVINNDGNWGHVGIYSGNGRMIHAPRTGRHVEEVDVLSGYWSQFPHAIRRIG